MKNIKLLNDETLYSHIISLCEKINGKAYLFFDEIQAVTNWEKVVASFLVDLDCDIFISGSNSKLLSGELATHIAGRYVHFDVFPLVFSEAKQLSIQNNTFISNEDLFRDYLRLGGLPQRFSFNAISVASYISDVFDAIVIKDIVDRSKITEVHLLRAILYFLLDNIGNPFSARSIVAALSAGGVKTTIETVNNYIDFIKKSMILYSVQRYDIKGKKLLSTNEKYYCVDLGLRSLVKQNDQLDFNKLYENIVFLELLYRGYEINVGKTDEYEIDFIAYKNNEKIYVQVCYQLGSDETIAREFGNLKRIKDNYPKLVISGDLPDFSRDGIKHFNIIDFLLNEK